MEPNYGAVDDEAQVPLLSTAPIVSKRRGRRAAAVIGTACLVLAATATRTGKQKVANLIATGSLATPSVDWVYDVTVTQNEFWTLTCGFSQPGTQPYALCGLTTCSGLEDHPDVAACKCAPETVNEMYEGAPMESTFRMGSSSIFLSQSVTYREAVSAQYAGTLDTAAFCTALTDGTICDESGLGCDYISFHTGASNSECRRKLDSNTDKDWVVEEVEVCMGAPCYQLEGNMGDDSDGCQMACLCPIGAGGLSATFYDDVVAADFTDTCFAATTVSTLWTPTLKQVNQLVTSLSTAGKTSAQQAANCDCTVSTEC